MNVRRKSRGKRRRKEGSEEDVYDANAENLNVIKPTIMIV